MCSSDLLTSPEALATRIDALAQSGDMVVCLGAGSITTWANALPGELEVIRQARKEAANDAG